MRIPAYDQRYPIWALVAVILTAALFGAFGHVHNDLAADHGTQPCAACAAVSLLVTALLVCGFIVVWGLDGRLFDRASVKIPRLLLLAGGIAQRAPPCA